MDEATLTLVGRMIFSQMATNPLMYTSVCNMIVDHLHAAGIYDIVVYGSGEWDDAEETGQYLNSMMIAERIIGIVYDLLLPTEPIEQLNYSGDDHTNAEHE